MLALSEVPLGTPNVLVALHVAGFVRVATMVSFDVRPVAMNAVTIAVLPGAVLNCTSTPVSVLAFAPVLNACAASYELRVCATPDGVCPPLLMRGRGPCASGAEHGGASEKHDGGAAASLRTVGAASVRAGRPVGRGGGIGGSVRV